MKKCWQQQNFDSDPKEVWHYNHVTFTQIAKNFMLYCRLIYMLSMLYVRLRIKVKVGIPESFKVGWYPHKITGSSHLKVAQKHFWWIALITFHLYFEFPPQKDTCPLGKLRTVRIHWPDCKIHKPQAIGHDFLCTLKLQVKIMFRLESFSRGWFSISFISWSLIFTN